MIQLKRIKKNVHNQTHRMIALACKYGEMYFKLAKVSHTYCGVSQHYFDIALCYALQNKVALWDSEIKRINDGLAYLRACIDDHAAYITAKNRKLRGLPPEGKAAIICDDVEIKQEVGVQLIRPTGDVVDGKIHQEDFVPEIYKGELTILEEPLTFTWPRPNAVHQERTAGEG